jgi:hypothetical protein
VCYKIVSCRLLRNVDGTVANSRLIRLIYGNGETGEAEL